METSQIITLAVVALVLIVVVYMLREGERGHTHPSPGQRENHTRDLWGER